MEPFTSSLPGQTNIIDGNIEGESRTLFMPSGLDRPSEDDLTREEISLLVADHPALNIDTKISVVVSSLDPSIENIHLPPITIFCSGQALNAGQENSLFILKTKGEKSKLDYSGVVDVDQIADILNFQRFIEKYLILKKVLPDNLYISIDGAVFKISLKDGKPTYEFDFDSLHVKRTLHPKAISYICTLLNEETLLRNLKPEDFDTSYKN